MKIMCVSLGRNGTQSLTSFIRQQGFSATHFYQFDQLSLGDFSEDADGIMKHFESLPYTDAHVDIPTCLVFDQVYDKFPDAKYINITRPSDDWLASMLKMNRLMGHEGDPFIFEEAYCNFYSNTGKNKIQDLTTDEFLFIREKHLERVSDFFKDKDNYLEVELYDPEIASKIKEFIGAELDIDFPNYDGFRKLNTN